MCRGVFAITWFFLIASALVSLFAIQNKLIFSDLNKQGTLMNAEELFYKARNFEYDFKHAVSEGTTQDFFEKWSGEGDLIYGYFSKFPKKHCVSVNKSFSEFIESSLLWEGDIAFFSPVGFQQSCMTLELDGGGFKTFGIIVSPICINTSSRLLFC